MGLFADAPNKPQFLNSSDDCESSDEFVYSSVIFNFK